eukprot:1120977-Pelagomonas_calceolata.AAC.8
MPVYQPCDSMRTGWHNKSNYWGPLQEVLGSLMFLLEACYETSRMKMCPLDEADAELDTDIVLYRRQFYLVATTDRLSVKTSTASLKHQEYACNKYPAAHDQALG